MQKIEYKKGDKFGRLSFLQDTSKEKTRKALWLCECGNKKEIIIQNVKRGKTKSCGCLNSEVVIRKNYKHGFSKKGSVDKFYRAWLHLKERCFREGDSNFHNYGGRGITVCRRWVNFENFKKDMYSSYLKHVKKYGRKNTTIERVDVNGDYEPGNCKWATPEEQANNRRNNHLITFKGETKTLSQFAKEHGLKPGRLRVRLVRDKFSVKKALTTPLKK